MHAQHLGLLLLQSASTVLGASIARDSTASPGDQISALAQAAYLQARAEANNDTTGKYCSWDKIQVRREWGSLCKDERRAYIKAVQCLQSKSPLTPLDVSSGVRSRFDDFVATHINQTLTIHYTGNFLGWHRYYTWLYEEALRVECGYLGTQPYWDWAKTAETGMHASPIFDGSDTSMSGDGAPIANQGDIVLGGPGLPPVYLSPGPGGGCVTAGPFANMTVNLGPASLDAPGGAVVANPNGPLTYNPRCLSRSLTDSINRDFANVSSILRTLEQTTVYDFQMVMQGIPGTGDIGVHGGGHYALGGDPGRDVYVSPGEPAFYLHHSMIDRTWWLWQMQDPATRVWSDAAISGTNTFLNTPPSANTTLQDTMQYGYAAGPPRALGDLMSTQSGPFCYVYL